MQGTDSLFCRSGFSVARLLLSAGSLGCLANNARNTANRRELGALGGVAKTAEFLLVSAPVKPQGRQVLATWRCWNRRRNEGVSELLGRAHHVRGRIPWSVGFESPSTSKRGTDTATPLRPACQCLTIEDHIDNPAVKIRMPAAQSVATPHDHRRRLARPCANRTARSARLPAIRRRGGPRPARTT